MNTFQAKASIDRLAIYRENPQRLTGLCLWREAEGESYLAKVGVLWSLKNRCAMAPEEGFKPTIAENILKPGAYSSFNHDDPRAVKFPPEKEPAWIDCQRAVLSNDPDPTDGAVFYHDPRLSGPPKVWGPVEHTVTIGHLAFYRKAKTVPEAGPEPVQSEVV